MGYSFYIGNAVPFFSKDDGELRAKWVVEEVENSLAPRFPNDDHLLRSNRIMPSYELLEKFVKEAGSVEPFNKYNFMWDGSPGCVILEDSDLMFVRAALKKRMEISTKPPGFYGVEVYNKEKGKWELPADYGKYDYVLAILLWLEWWMDWALRNCETPAFANQ